MVRGRSEQFSAELTKPGTKAIVGQGVGADDDSSATLADLLTGKLKHRELESRYSPRKAVTVRRKFIERISGKDLGRLPYENYDYSIVSVVLYGLTSHLRFCPFQVNGACCENIIGIFLQPLFLH